MGPVHRQRGFSWIEVLVSVFIIGTAAVVVGEVFPMATKSQTMVNNEQQAGILIQHKIDQMRAIGYGRLTLTEMNDAGIVDSSMSGSNFTFTTTDSLSTVFPSGAGTITVSDFSSVIKQVTVSITWGGTARRQGNGSISVIALIAKS